MVHILKRCQGRSDPITTFKQTSDYNFSAESIGTSGLVASID